MCAEIYERTFVTMQHLVAAKKFTKMWAEVYERPFVNMQHLVAEKVSLQNSTFVNVGREFTNARS